MSIEIKKIDKMIDELNVLYQEFDKLGFDYKFRCDAIEAQIHILQDLKNNSLDRIGKWKEYLAEDQLEYGYRVEDS